MKTEDTTPIADDLIAESKGKPVIATSLSMGAYLASSAWGSSEIKNFRLEDGGCPNRVKEQKENKEDYDDDTPARKFGRMYHSFLLEPHKFKKEFRVADAKVMAELLERLNAQELQKAPKKFSKQLGAYKRWLESGYTAEQLTPEIEAKLLKIAQDEKLSDSISPQMTIYKDWKKQLATQGYEAITEEDKETATKMAEAITRRPEIMKHLDQEGKAEVSIFVESGLPHLNLKARPDWMPTNGNVMLDLKTTRDAHIDSFSKDVINFGYHYQAWHHMAVARLAGFNKSRFGWIAQEKEYPYEAALIWCPQELLEEAEMVMMGAMKEISLAYETGKWEGHYSDIDAQIPDWYMKHLEALGII